MSGKRIFMTGADGAEYQSVIGLQSRLVTFPDGITRHITLNNWQWEVLDFVHQDAGDAYLPEGAYLHALEFWLLDTFNEAAIPRRRIADRLADLRENAADITDRYARPWNARFEARLRRSLAQMIKVNMPSVTGRNDPAND